MPELDDAPSESASAGMRVAIERRSAKPALWCGISLFVLVLAMSAFITALLPRQFVAIARIRLEKAGAETNEMQAAYDPYFIQTEMEMIKSHRILERALQRLDSAQRWPGTDGMGAPLPGSEQFQLLRQRLDVRQSPQASLVEIRFYSESAEQAAEVANEIAEAYLGLQTRGRAQLVDRAEPTLRSVRPNVPLNLFLGLIAGVVSGTGAAGLGFWLTPRTSPGTLRPERPTRRVGLGKRIAAVAIPTLISVALFVAFSRPRIRPEIRSPQNEKSQPAVQPEIPALAKNLEIRLVATEADTAQPFDEMFLSRNGNRQTFHVLKTVLLDDDAVARAGLDRNPVDGKSEIRVKLTAAGTRQFEQVTQTNIDRQLAIVYRDRLLSAPILRVAIAGGEFSIEGNLSDTEAYTLIDALNRAPIPSLSLQFNPTSELVLPRQGQTNRDITLLDLDTGRFTTNRLMDMHTREWRQWVQDCGGDVMTIADPRFSTLYCFDMVMVPEKAKPLEACIPADVLNNWSLATLAPASQKLITQLPATDDTYLFRTRENGWGALQIVGESTNPPGVRIRFKLVLKGSDR